jgi:anti-sigma regulatory factor (Ser/Thr protein kinase)
MVTEFGRSAYGEPLVPEHEYFERAQQINALSDLFGRAGRGEIAGGLIEGPRGIGKSDLIRRAIFHRLKEDRSTVFIYYQIQPYTLELFDLACGYFNTFIRQYRYAHHGESADLQECIDAWHSGAPQCKKCPEPALREICEGLGRAYVQRDVANTLSLLVNMPRYLAELQGRRCVVILDHARYLWQVHYQGHGVALLRQWAAHLESRVTPLFLADSSAGLRTMLGGQATGDQLTVFEPARLDEHEAVVMLETLCERLGVNLSVRMADRMIPQFGGLPLYIHNLVRRAHLASLGLDTTEQFGKVYAQDIRDGAIHWFWRAQFSTQFPQSAERQQVAEMCSHLAGSFPQRVPLAQLSKRFSLEPAKLQKMIKQLQLMGVLDRSFGTVGLVDDPVLRDVVTILAWGDSSATTDAELLRRLAARRVRGASTPPIEETTAEFIGRLERFLQTFRGQYLPAEWFHYHDDYGAGWAGPEGIRRALGSSDTLVRLPYLMAVSRIDVARLSGEGAALRPIVLCGAGFRDKQLTPGNETQWVAMVWPTADPVGIEHVHESMRLRNEVAKRTGREVGHTWLIGKATFSREARQMCSQSRLFTGNMAMVNYIYDQLFAKGSPYGATSSGLRPVPEMVVSPPAAAQAEPQVVEMCLPAGNYPERSATEAIEGVARAAGFSPARMGDIKLAVLEAVIHAGETSADPSEKIHVRYWAVADRLEVSVRCRDQSLLLQPSEPPRAADGEQTLSDAKGLPMIHSLADEVAIWPAENGAEIQMTFRREAQEAADKKAEVGG